MCLLLLVCVCIQNTLMTIQRNQYEPVWKPVWIHQVYIRVFSLSYILKVKEIVPYIFSAHIFDIRVHEIAYGFGGPSEKMSVVINFLLQNTNLVSVLSKICINFAAHVWQDWPISWTLIFHSYIYICVWYLSYCKWPNYMFCLHDILFTIIK